MEELEALRADALAQLEAVDGADALEQWRIDVLGTKGRLKALTPGMKDVPKEQKPQAGKLLNEVKSALETAFADRSKTVAASGGSSGPAAGASAGTTGPLLDVTEPGISPGLGGRHVLTRTMDELAEVFARMGFSISQGPEVEDEWHNFVALNIPEDHPARDPLENFYIDGKHLLRTQTSTVQIRTMENASPPLKIISMGRVYRPDEVDATHSDMFHQIEGLYVDRNVSMVDLKTTLLQFAHAYFGADAEVRLVPSFFPFTEPSAEMYVRMHVKGTLQWVELGGCGMVDPNVFEAVGYDPEQWSGFAFGLGIERIAMRKYGIPDIRWFYENDVRFLKHFA